MRKLSIVAAFAFFAACGNGNENYDTQDSLRAMDSMNNAQSMAVDSASNMQKNNIDSMQQGSGTEDTAAGSGTR